MSIRSDILVHWTGRDICSNPDALTNSKRELYVERLRSILLEGLWMTKPVENLVGNGATPNENTKMYYDSHMTCFTEIRLSRANEHASRYGILGIGVDRKFVLNRLGGPVHYVRNSLPEQIIGNWNEVLLYIKATHDEIKDPILKKRFKDVENYFACNLSLVKGMSQLPDDFMFLEENEWRIIHFYRLETDGYIKKVGATETAKPLYKVILKPDDIRTLVFPDDATRTMALENPEIKSWLAERTSAVVTLTLHECGEF